VFAAAVGIERTGEGDIRAVVAGEDRLGVILEELGAREGLFVVRVRWLGDVFEALEAIFGFEIAPRVIVFTRTLFTGFLLASTRFRCSPPAPTL